MTAPDKNVDPSLWPLVEAFPPVDVGSATLAAFRAAMKELSVKPEPSTHPDVLIEEIRIPGEGIATGTVRCLLFRATREKTSSMQATPAPAGALLHIHGGGFVMGSPEMDVARNIELARATGCTILSVDYRLAPEHPHPAGLEDCHAALAWLAANADSLGVSRGRIGVIGESAGGGLAGAVALLARDRDTLALAQRERTAVSVETSVGARGSVGAQASMGTQASAGAQASAAAQDRLALACQVLIYPMMVPPAQSIDATEPDPRAGRYIWTRASNSYCWSAYLSGDPASPSTIAGLAPDLAGLPPTFIAVGELDLFVHDNLAYARRLLTAGCSVEAHLYPGAIHGFDRAVEAPVTQRYTRDLFAFIRKHLA